VEARGLKPNTKYFYQWRYRQNDRKAPVYSTTGRTRTLPRADEDIKRVRLAFFGCSQLVSGNTAAWNTAWKHSCCGMSMCAAVLSCQV
jgi:phosphodiesterase/alkaline phosphatase D-like protein